MQATPGSNQANECMAITKVLDYNLEEVSGVQS
jgi:hypothetical protein